MFNLDIESEMLEHFPDDIIEEFEMPFIRTVGAQIDKETENMPEARAVNNWPVGNITIFKLRSDKFNGLRSRDPTHMKSDGIHETVHSLTAQQRYDIDNYGETVSFLNNSFDRRNQLPMESGHDWFKRFGGDIIVYNSDEKIQRNSFIYRPDVEQLERTVALSLKEDEVEEKLDEYREVVLKAFDKWGNERLPWIENEFEKDIAHIVDEASQEEIEHYMAPIRQAFKLQQEDRGTKLEKRDEAMARFYVSATQPEYIQNKFERMDEVPKDIDLVGPESQEFTEYYADIITEGYDENTGQIYEEFSETTGGFWNRGTDVNKLLISF
jgi:hypothetical protein